MAATPSDDLSQRRALFQALTGNERAAVGGQSSSVRDMLGTLYGTTRNGKASIDTREAARRLGVSQRTVQRWIKNDNTPNTDHLKKLRTRSRQASTTKRGRARSLRRSAKQRALRGANRVQVSIHGTQGPKDYPREGRNSTRDLTPEQYQALTEAYAQGGDTAAMQYLTDLWSETYVDDWRFNQINTIRINELGGGTRADPRMI